MAVMRMKVPCPPTHAQMMFSERLAPHSTAAFFLAPSCLTLGTNHFSNCCSFRPTFQVVTLWSHELRGFRTDDAQAAAHHLHGVGGHSDLASWITSPLEMVVKTQVVSVQTEHQRIDVWDALERDDTPSYEDGQRLGLAPGDPRWSRVEHATPGRLLFLDGALQASGARATRSPRLLAPSSPLSSF